MNYKVTKNDLKGELDGFSIEVVQRMVDCQVEQGNEANVKLFQENVGVGQMDGGFSWSETKEGRIFWDEVINDYRFDYLFAMSSITENYETEELKDETKELSKVGESTQKDINTHVYYRGVFNRGEEIISELEKLGGNNSYGEYNGKSNKEYYFIHPTDHQIRRISTEPKYTSEDLPLDFLKSFYTEKFLPEVQPETIEIDGKKYNKQEILDRVKELKEVE